MPLGPYSLCAEMDMRSTPRSFTLTGTCNRGELLSREPPGELAA